MMVVLALYQDRSRTAVKRMARPLLVIALLFLAVPVHAHRIWLLVDTADATLSVMRHGEALAHFSGISVGRGGVSAQRSRGDDSTPLGEFHIVGVNTQSMYRRFYVFDFPNAAHAERAHAHGLINKQTLESITKAVDTHRLPPQNTALGGFLGIHGLGNADPGVHQAFNWTNGCIALTNEQIDALSSWVRVGTKVIVQ